MLFNFTECFIIEQYGKHYYRLGELHEESQKLRKQYLPAEISWLHYSGIQGLYSTYTVSEGDYKRYFLLNNGSV